MKLLLVNGSLKEKDAASAALLAAGEELKRAGAETGLFWPIQSDNLYCSGCGACKGSGMCVYDPRGLDFVKAAAESEGLLFVLPAGLFGLDVPVRNFFERVKALTRKPSASPLYGKPAAAVILCRRGGRTKAAKQAADYLSELGLRLPAEGEVPALSAGDASAAQTLLRLAKDHIFTS